MRMRNNERLCLAFMISVMIFVMFIRTVSAGGHTVVPTLSVRGEYNDNVRFRREKAQDDWLGYVRPGLEHHYKSETWIVDTDLSADFIRYLDDDNLNTENYRTGFEAAFTATERLTVNGSFSWLKDTTLDSELLETGIVNDRDDRHRLDGGMGFVFQIRPATALQTDYMRGKTEYDSEGFADYDVDTLVLSLNHTMRDQRNIFTLQPYANHWSSDVSDIENYGLSMGWTHHLTDLFSISMMFGVRRTEMEYTGTSLNNDDDWGQTADLNVRKSGEMYSVRFGFNRNIRTDAFGSPVEIDHFSANFRYRLLHHLNFVFLGHLYFNRSESRPQEDDRYYYDLVPALNYEITELHTLQFAYGFSRDYNRHRVDNRESVRNRVWVALNLRLPQ